MEQKCYIGVPLSTILLVWHVIFAQGTLEPEWLIKRLSPVSNQESQAWGVDVENNGNVYWATNQIYPGQGFDIILYKLDADSNEVWPSPAIYGGALNQQSFIVTVSGDRVYIAGRELFTLPSSNMLILAVDIFSGATLWSTIWDQGYGYDEVDGIMVGNDGIYITGWTTGDTTGIDIALLKLDFDGNIIQTNTWGSDLFDHQDGHAVMDDSVIYVAGLYGSPSVYNGESLLAKFSRDNLSHLDHITFGGNGPWPNQENAQGMTSDGTYLYLVGVTTVSFNNVDIFVAKFDKNLHQLWYELWGGVSFESARGITIADNGNIYVGANTTSFGAGDEEVVLLSYSPDGNFLGYRTWGGTEKDGIQDIRAEGNSLYLTGKSMSLHPVNNWAAYLMKVNIDSITVSIHSEPVIYNYSLEQNYPNPFNPSTTIEFSLPNSQFATLKIFNLLGEKVVDLVSEELTAGSYPYTWDAGNLSSGIYYYRLTAGTFVETRKMVLMR